MSQTASDTPWPPRSPHEVLMGTPGGRDRLKRLAERTSPSPSPIKRSKSTPAFLSKATTGMGMGEDEDEDEEMLQLKLQEIQARLKLKKAQKAKQRDPEGLMGEQNGFDDRSGAAPLSRALSAAASRGRAEQPGLRDHKGSQSNVDVPVSPIRRPHVAEQARSPGRVLLGIDKGLKGSDVSLRRAPSLRKPLGEPMNAVQQATGYLRRANSQQDSRSVPGSQQNALQETGIKPMSFSERMASKRTEDADRQEKEARIKQARSKAFGIGEHEMGRYKKTATTIPETKPQGPEFTRDQILSTYNKEPSGLLQRSKTISYLKNAGRAASNSTTTSSQSSYISDSKPVSGTKRNPSAKAIKAARADPDADTPDFEPFSCMHLSKRILPHNVLTRQLAGKKIFDVPDLLKTVVAPNFSLPEVEQDIVLLAVICSKSEPKKQKSRAGGSEPKLFMILNVCDLKWELDVYLFNTAFDKFWKLTVGTVVAILNPGIMPPLRADTGRFTLTLNSDDDTVLEIGTARDLGFCKSVKKDGKFCDSWVDKRHTEFCDFHINEVINKTRAARMEVNTMNFGRKKGDSSAYGARKTSSYVINNFEERQERQTNRREGIRYDMATQSTIYVSKPGQSGEFVRDQSDHDPFAFENRGLNKVDLITRRFAEAEKQRETARKLAEQGGGLGADYMKRHEQTQNIGEDKSSDKPELPPDAAALGLLRNSGKTIHLSPIKRKRTDTGTTSSTEAMGWGGNLTKELGRMKDGERLQPIKKKTRFITSKGIREAGRESFGADVAHTDVNENHDDDDDDDDDLDIIR